MKRTAFGVWRWAGATSPGRMYCTAVEIVCVLVRSGTPGLSRRKMRRSAPRPGVMNSALRRTSGSISVQRQSRAWTADAFGRMSGPGSAHGASRPAARRSAWYASRSLARSVACSVIFVPPGRQLGHEVTDATSSDTVASAARGRLKVDERAIEGQLSLGFGWPERAPEGHAGRAGQRRVHCRLLDNSDKIEFAEHERQAVGSQWRWAGHDVEMQVWRRGVSRVAEPPQLLIDLDPLTGDDPDAIALEVGVKGEDSVSMIENDEIAVDVAHGNCLRVGQGAWCLIGQVVAGGDDAPGRGGEDARAVAHPASHFLQVAHRQPPLGVGPHEVDGEPLGVEQLAVDGLNRAAMRPGVATATVDDEPAPALERRPEDVGLPRRQRKWGQAVLH